MKSNQPFLLYTISQYSEKFINYQRSLITKVVILLGHQQLTLHKCNTKIHLQASHNKKNPQNVQILKSVYLLALTSLQKDFMEAKEVKSNFFRRTLLLPVSSMIAFFAASPLAMSRQAKMILPPIRHIIFPVTKKSNLILH